MAYINVDHSKFEAAASAIETYLDRMKTKMNTASGEITKLSAAWQGDDFNQFKAQWEKVTAGDSTYSEMRKSFEAYAKFLRFAAQKYKDAQIDAINRANSLPRW